MVTARNSQPRPPKFLIADDHVVVRRGVREMLADEFPEATFGEAANAQETLESVWKQRWSLIVLDIGMPGRSGLDILKELKAAQPKTPVLVQSMHSEAHFAMRVFKGGAAGYVTKESVAEELIGAVHKVLGGGRYVTATLAEEMTRFLAEGNEGQSPVQLLSDREFQVLRMLAGGMMSKEIAAQLSLSAKTVSTYNVRILKKLNLRTHRDLVEYALREGVIE